MIVLVRFNHIMKDLRTMMWGNRKICLMEKRSTKAAKKSNRFFHQMIYFDSFKFFSSVQQITYSTDHFQMWKFSEEKEGLLAFKMRDFKARWGAIQMDLLCIHKEMLHCHTVSAPLICDLFEFPRVQRSLEHCCSLFMFRGANYVWCWKLDYGTKLYFHFIKSWFLMLKRACNQI